jgi:hypothetical protein
LAAEARAAEAPAAAFPLGVHKSGRYLVDRRGAPFFVHGDSPWSLTHNWTYEQADRYLLDRKARGFNALIVSVPDAYGPDGKATDPPDAQGHRPFVDDDITRLNEPYWAHVDRVLARTEALGFAVFLFPAYLGYKDDGYMALFLKNGPDKARQYGRLVGRRFKARKNLVWVHGGDRDPAEARDVVAAVRAGIDEEDKGHLRIAHWAQEIDPYGPFGADWVDFYTTYTYKPLVPLLARHVAHTPRKPVILVETHYEDDFGKRTAADARKYPYRAVLSGAAGHFFGNKPLWFSGHGWEEALDKPGSQAMVHVGRLFRSRPWWDLVPDRGRSLCTAGCETLESDDGVQAALTADRSTAMAFLPSRRAITMDLSRMSGRSVKASWFDVVSGEVTPGGAFPTGAAQRFEPPRDGEWVLVLDDAAKKRPAPGAPAGRAR